MGGTPLTEPFGHNFWFYANFQTAANPFNAANTHVTSSDIAFWGDLAYVGDYGGFRIFNISRPTPTLVSDVRCYGPQGDPSVFDRDGDGNADTLVLSVDSPLAGPQCGAAPGEQERDDRQVPGRHLGGHPRLRRLRPAGSRSRSRPSTRTAARTPTRCSRHRAARAVDVRAQLELSARRGPDVRSARRRAAGRKVNHGVVQVVEMPFNDPSKAKELTELPVVYPGDADGTYRPVRDHGIVAPLDNFLGCHDLSSFPDLGIVGAACGEQAQVWKIDRSTGLPDTAKPKWSYDQPNVDFWHSATFSWDGKVANFIDESFGDGCPT